MDMLENGRQLLFQGCHTVFAWMNKVNDYADDTVNYTKLFVGKQKGLLNEYA